MERTDWLDVGFDSAQAQFLMVTAITHHRLRSADKYSFMPNACSSVHASASPHRSTMVSRCSWGSRGGCG